MDKPIAIVTGAGSGIGRAITARLLRDGFAVALAGRREAPLAAVAADHDPDGHSTLLVAADVGQPEDVARLFDTVVTKWQRLDLLVNNAGTGAPAVPLEDVSPEIWQTILTTNVSGAFYCTQAAFRTMKAQSPQGGRIINNGSISATTPRPRQAPYAITKHAISGLTKATALDGRPFNIACGQIDIGNARSSMTDAMAEGVLQADGRMAPEPVMDVAHVADAVGYMASLPLDANVLNLTVLATGMPFVGRG